MIKLLKVSNYVIISALFIIVFVIFTAFNPGSYIFGEEGAGYPVISRVYSDASGYGDYGGAVVIARSDSAALHCITQTLEAVRIPHEVNFEITDGVSAELMIITTADFDFDNLQKYINGGGNVIFSVLPENPTAELASLLGITSHEPRFTGVSLDIYEGILAGGWFHADDYAIDCARVTLSGKCKILADTFNTRITLQTNTEQRKAAANPVIWRTYSGSSVVIAVNAPFFENETGAGIFSGLLSFVYGDFIYPVIGTKTAILDNFPNGAESSENETAGVSSAQINGRSPFIFIRDIMWPDLLLIAKRQGIKYSCFTGEAFFKSSEAGLILDFMEMELIKIMRGQIGYGTKYPPDATEFSADVDYIKNRYSLPRLKLNSIITQNIPEGELPGFDDFITAAVTREWGAGYCWAGEQTAVMPLTGFDTSETVRPPADYAAFSEKAAAGAAALASESLVSAYAVILHSFDLTEIFRGTAAWNNYSLAMSGRLAEVYSKYPALTPATVAEAAEAVKDYLNTVTSVKLSGDSLKVSMLHNAGEISFILRSAKKIGEIENCTVEEISEGFYMVRSPGPEFKINLK